MTDPAALGVVVVNYASSALLRANLGAMRLPEGARVVVVDNFSTSQERGAVVALCRERGWTGVCRPANDGFGIGVNAGAAAALALGAEVLLLLNPDASIGLDALTALVSGADRDRRLLAAPRVVRPDGSTWFAGAGLDLRTGVTRGQSWEGAEPWLTGACLVLHRDLWRELGGFDDDYFLYWEDIDLSHRCLLAGGSLQVRDDLLAVHAVGGTQGHARAKSAAYYYYNCRNRMLFAAKHLPRRDVLRWALGAVAHARRVVLRGGRRQLLRPAHNLWPAARGTLAGLLWCASVGRRPRPVDPVDRPHVRAA